MVAAYRRYAGLDRADRRLVLEAVIVMAIVQVLLRRSSCVGLRRALSRYARWRTPSLAPDTRYIERIQWAVSAASTRIPAATCLVQALTADTLLQRGGFDSELCLGVRKRGAEPESFEAHAWVTCEQRVVVGAGDDPAGFTLLSRSGSW